MLLNVIMAVENRCTGFFFLLFRLDRKKSCQLMFIILMLYFLVCVCWLKYALHFVLFRFFLNKISFGFAVLIMQKLICFG